MVFYLYVILLVFKFWIRWLIWLQWLTIQFSKFWVSWTGTLTFLQKPPKCSVAVILHCFEFRRFRCTQGTNRILPLTHWYLVILSHVEHDLFIVQFGVERICARKFEGNWDSKLAIWDLFSVNLKLRISRACHMDHIQRMKTIVESTCYIEMASNSSFKHFCIIRSRVKGDHVYRADLKINTLCACYPEPVPNQ